MTNLPSPWVLNTPTGIPNLEGANDQIPNVGGGPPSNFGGPPTTSGGLAPPPGAANGLTMTIPSPSSPDTSASPAPSTGSPFDSDPGYAGARAAEQLGIPSINTAMNNLISQRIAAYGDPSFASQAGFGLDPQAAAFARQNYLTGNADLARIDRSHQQARQQIINRLAGHGLLFSGDTGYQTGQEDQGYGNNVYDAQQKVLADILGYRQGALGQTQGLRQNSQQALAQAWQNYINHPEMYPAPGGQQKTSTTLPPPPKPPSAKGAVVSRLGLNRQARA